MFSVAADSACRYTFYSNLIFLNTPWQLPMHPEDILMLAQVSHIYTVTFGLQCWPFFLFWNNRYLMNETMVEVHLFTRHQMQFDSFILEQQQTCFQRWTGSASLPGADLCCRFPSDPLLLLFWSLFTSCPCVVSRLIFCYVSSTVFLVWWEHKEGIIC